jgi:hypothetical protein
MSTKNWFEVDRSGLKALQEGKSKTFVVRELIQNAFDEEIKRCRLFICYNGYNKATIIVEDDSPVGFRDLTDAYTLFKQTYKRADATKRGRFNLGEKQVFAVAESAEIMTTRGGVRLDDGGRTTLRKKREKGSVITVNLKMTADETFECFEYAKTILIPEGVDFDITYSRDEGKTFIEAKPEYRKPFRSFNAKLRTELEVEGIFRPTTRNTSVNIHKLAGAKYLYEMGIPVCQIDCDYSIDVQQKVPLSTDREAVSPAFLNDVYAEVLNHVFDDLNEETVSSAWIHDATSNDRITQEALTTVITERYGDKVVSFTPNDPNANDEALSHGYHVLKGSELGGDVWGNLKKYDLINSSSSMFGSVGVAASPVDPTTNQKAVANWAKKYFKEFFGVDLLVTFVSAPTASTVADFTHLGSSIRFNVPKIKFKWVDDGCVSQEMLDLIVHEFGHRRGNHTDHAYHECLTKQAAWLAYKVMKNPNYLKV